VGGEAVAVIVLGRGGFAFFRFGTGGMLGVGSVRVDLRFGRHFGTAPWVEMEKAPQDQNESEALSETSITGRSKRFPASD
jgi:hypothetical protein